MASQRERCSRCVKTTCGARIDARAWRTLGWQVPIRPVPGRGFGVVVMNMHEILDRVQLRAEAGLADGHEGMCDERE